MDEASEAVKHLLEASTADRSGPAVRTTGSTDHLTAADLAYFTAAGVLIGVITSFFAAGPLGAGGAGVGLAVGAFSVTTLVLGPLERRWTDRYGRRPLLSGGAGLFAVMIVGHLLVTDLAWLVGLWVLLGVAEAVFFVAGFAALADLARPGRAGRGAALQLIGALSRGLPAVRCRAGPIRMGRLRLGLGGRGAVRAGGRDLRRAGARDAAAERCRVPVGTADPPGCAGPRARPVHRGGPRVASCLLSGRCAPRSWV